MHRIESLKIKDSEERAKELIITKINADEKKAVECLFRLYDIGSQGNIAVHHARKLLKNMGFEAERISLGTDKDRVTLRDLYIIIESELPQPQPSLPCSLYTFDRIVGKEDDADGRLKIRPDEIKAFHASIGRQATGDGTEIGVLLSKMLAVDDCSLVPAVTVETFDREVIAFAKRNQIYKDADFEDPTKEKGKRKAVALGDGRKLKVDDTPPTTASLTDLLAKSVMNNHMTDTLLLPKRME